MMLAAWEKVVHNVKKVDLQADKVQELRMTIDWSSEGRGYVLWLGKPIKSEILGLTVAVCKNRRLAC